MVAVGSTVRATAGPYEGRTGIIKRKRDDGFLEVELAATEYAAAATGMFDPRYIVPWTKLP